MTHSAKILADSISPDGVRLTTLECVYPRIVHAEMMTHRVFSRNAASSRAIPVEKMIKTVQENPYVPTHWGKNQRGMQADEELSLAHQKAATVEWLHARDEAIYRAQNLLTVGVHKQVTNRLLEPFLWYTCIITATEWDNFFHLRCHKDAHPEIRKVAEFMHNVMQRSEPDPVNYGDWHLPLVDANEAFALEVGREFDWCKVSVGRCARVSYLTHDGKRDPAEDVALCDRLLAAGHMSPFEHVARPMDDSDIGFDYVTTKSNALNGVDIPHMRESFTGNFRGWVQYRKEIPNEHDVLGARS